MTPDGGLRKKKLLLSELRLLVITKEGLIVRIISTVPPPFLGLVSVWRTEYPCLYNFFPLVLTYLCWLDFCSTFHCGMSPVPEASIYGGAHFIVITYFIEAILILPTLPSRANSYFLVQKLSPDNGLTTICSFI